LIGLDFVAIFRGVIRPRENAFLRASSEGRRRALAALSACALMATLGWAAWGCREAPTPTGPKPSGPSQSAPAIVTLPGRDTTVDSIGLMLIEVIVRDPVRIDTVALQISGASLAFPADTVNDTVFNATFPIALGPLRHQRFSFRVAAGDILGHDTLTDSVIVRLK
jgi:hypothetical protein